MSRYNFADNFDYSLHPTDLMPECPKCQGTSFDVSSNGDILTYTCMRCGHKVNKKKMFQDKKIKLEEL